MNSASRIDVLLVEDNSDDVELARLACEEIGGQVHLHHAPDGAQGMAFLRKAGQHANQPTPDLVLLDLNMPIMNGFEVLEEIARDPSLQALTVVVFTTSESEQDRLRAKRLRCSAYVVKPSRFRDFVEVLRVLIEFPFHAAAQTPAKSSANRADMRRVLEDRNNRGP